MSKIPQQDKLVAYYKLNGTYKNYAGSTDVDDQVVNSPTITTNELGRQATQFNGTTQAFYANINMNCSLFTMACRFKADNTSAFYTIMNKNLAADDEIMLGINTGGVIQFSSGSYGMDPATVTSVDAGVEYFITGTFDGTYWKLYIDGELSEQKNDPATLSNINGAYMGCGWNEPDLEHYFPGYVSDAFYYSGVALTAAEVKELYDYTRIQYGNNSSVDYTADEALRMTFTVGAGQNVTMPTNVAGTYAGTIDWGDGSDPVDFSGYNDSNLSYTYASAGTYQVAITGLFSRFSFTGHANRTHLVSVENLGSTGLTTLDSAFYGCSNLTSIESGDSNLSTVTSMASFHRGMPANVYVHFDHADLSLCTSMDSAFRDGGAGSTIKFTNCNLSGLTNISYLFRYCGASTLIDFSGSNISAISTTTSWETNWSATTGLFERTKLTPSTSITSAIFKKITSYLSVRDAQITIAPTTLFSEVLVSTIDVTNFRFGAGSASNMFYMSANLSEIIGLETIDYSATTNMSGLVWGTALTRVCLENIDASSVTTLAHMCRSMPNLVELCLGGSDFSSVSTLESICDSTNSGQTISVDISNTTWANTSIISTDMFDLGPYYNLTATDVTFNGVTGILPWANNAYCLTADFTNYYTASSTLGYMFRNAFSLTSLIMTGYSGPNVATLSYMFTSCHSLTVIPEEVFTGSKTSSVTAASLMTNSTYSGAISLAGYDMSNLSSVSYMFSGCSNITSIDMTGADLSNCTGFNHMFYQCSNLSTANFTNLIATSSTTVESLFKFCTSLTTIILDGSEWGPIANNLDITSGAGSHTISAIGATFNAASYNAFFKNNRKVTSIDVTNAITTQANIDTMFYYTSELASINLTGLDISNATSIAHWFQYSGISAVPPTLELMNVGVSNKAATYFFDHCNNLVNADFGSMDLSFITNCSRFLQNCSGLTTVSFNGADLSSCTNLSFVFYGCSNLTTISILNTDFSAVTTIESLAEFATSLTSITIDGSSFGDITINTDMANGAGNHTLSAVGCTFTGYGHRAFTYNNAHVTAADFTNSSTTGNVDNWFYYASNLASVTLDGFTCPNSTTCSSMFNRSGLTDAGIPNFNLVSWPLMSGSSMFAYCTNLSTPSLDGQDFSFVSNADSFFTYCDFTAISFTNVDLSNATQTSNLFYYCDQCSVFDLSGIDISASVSLYRTFRYCTAITDVIFDGATLGPISNIGSIFEFCPANSVDVSAVGATFNGASYNALTYNNNVVKSVDYTNAIFTSTTSASMFWGAGNLASITLLNADFSNSTVFSNMFTNCGIVDPSVIGDIIPPSGSNVSCASMFSGCTNITAIDFSGLDLSYMGSWDSLFLNCTGLLTADFTNADMSGVTALSNVFNGCTSLTTITFDGVDISSNTSLYRFAKTTSALTNISAIGVSFGNISSYYETFSASHAHDIDLTGSDWSSTIVPFCDNANGFLQSLDMTNCVSSGSRIDIHTTSPVEIIVAGLDITIPTIINISSTNMTTTSYDQMLIDFDTDGFSSKTLNANSCNYTSAGSTARGNLVSKSWSITDSGMV